MGQVVSTAMKDTQRELQTEMQDKQLSLMIKTQERMRRVQVAQMLAVSRERFNWIGGVYASFIAAATTYAFKNKHLPPVVGVPALLGGVFVAYQWDFCYGSKLERIKKMTDEIATENHWFNPSTPTDEEVARIKRSHQ